MAGEPNDEKRAYSYSWLLPAPGTNPRDVPCATPTEQEGRRDATLEVSRQGREVPGVAQDVPRQAGVKGAMLVTPSKSGSPPFSPKAGRSTHSTSRLGSIVLLGWSALAGAGEVLVLVERSRTVVLRAGLLGLVWVAVSAAIWFFSSRSTD